MENNRFGRNTLIGGVLVLLSLAIAAVGVIVSLRTGNSQYFMACSIPAAVCIVAGGVMIRNDLRTGESRLLLPGGERTIKAKVKGITRNLRTEGEKTVCYVICSSTNPLTGREETYTSRSFDEYPGKEIIGREVTVRIDSREKGKYTVEIDDLLEEIKKEKTGNEQAE